MRRALVLPERLERTEDRQIDQAQRNANESTRAANKFGAAMQVLDAVTFTAGQTLRLVHGVALPSGATPAGWRVRDVSGGYGAFQRTAWDHESITIQSQNACTAVFEVFA